MRLPQLITSLSAVAYLAVAANGSPVTVTGSVLDAKSHKPIAGAKIGVYESGRGTVTTGKDGRFKVLAEPGKGRIIYYDGGNALYRSGPGTYTTVKVPPTGLSGVTLCLLQKEFAHGKVFSPSGAPLAAATVTIGGAEFFHATTDSKGLFKIEVPKAKTEGGG